MHVLEPADSLFSSCSGCHAMRWRTHGIGPDLMGIVGASVAAHENFQYSQAMRDYGGRWTRERLDRFLADPAAEVPGTQMQFAGIADAAARAQLIDFLAKMKLRAD